jgi:hypothetical protein
MGDHHLLPSGTTDPEIQHQILIYQSVPVVDTVAPKSQQQSGRIDSFEPTSVSAGVGDTLTIFGKGFRDQPGVIWWTSADTTDFTTETFSTGWSGYTTLWTDTKIVVTVPSGVGTGPIKLVTQSGDDITSDRILQVLLNLENPDQFYNHPEYGRQGSANSSGGYTFYFVPDFPADAKAAFKRAIDTWVNTVGVNWTVSDLNPGANPKPGTGTCVVRFDTTATSGDVIGEASSYFSICPQNPGAVLTEVDIAFDPTVSWFYGQDLSAIPSGQTDMETVALHELGHALQLGHVVDSSDIMHSAYTRPKRTLTAGATLRGAFYLRTNALSGSGCGQTLMNWAQIAPPLLGIQSGHDPSGEAPLLVTAQLGMPLTFELQSSAGLGKPWTTLSNSVFGGKAGQFRIAVSSPRPAMGMVLRAAVQGQ